MGLASVCPLVYGTMFSLAFGYVAWQSQHQKSVGSERKKMKRREKGEKKERRGKEKKRKNNTLEK